MPDGSNECVVGDFCYKSETVTFPQGEPQSMKYCIAETSSGRLAYRSFLSTFDDDDVFPISQSRP